MVYTKCMWLILDKTILNKHGKTVKRFVQIRLDKQFLTSTNLAHKQENWQNYNSSNSETLQFPPHKSVSKRLIIPILLRSTQKEFLPKDPTKYLKYLIILVKENGSVEVRSSAMTSSTSSTVSEKSIGSERESVSPLIRDRFVGTEKWPLR